MASLVVIYFSATGTTASLAAAIELGASSVLKVDCIRIEGRDIVDGRFRNEQALELVDNADAVIFGSPTYMGGPAAQFKAFADASSDRWSAGTWKNKVAAGFTTGTCANGDQSYTLTYFSVLAAQHGMLWCNLDIQGGYDDLKRNRLGTQVGLATSSAGGELPREDLLTAEYFGKRVAQLARRLAEI
jgi:NAD(P)H dehydrogenase (quinone)